MSIWHAFNTASFLFQAEYRPCVVFGLCWDMLREFLQGFLGSCVSNIPPHYFQVSKILNS